MFGQRIKEIRKLNKLTQKQLAELLDVSEATISKWECESSCPSLTTVIKICTTYNVSANYLLGINEDYMLNLNGLSPNVIMMLNRIVMEKKQRATI